MSHTAQSTQAPTKLVAGEGTFVAADARLEGGGVVELGAGCVVHPRASIVVPAGGRLVFGAGCVVEENARVASTASEARVGDNNIFGVGCSVSLVPGAAVGEWNTFAPRSSASGVRIGSHCAIGAGTVIDPAHEFFAASDPVLAALPDYSVVHGATSSIRTWDGAGEAQEHEVRLSANAFLREILPKFNKARPEAPGVIAPS